MIVSGSIGSPLLIKSCCSGGGGLGLEGDYFWLEVILEEEDTLDVFEGPMYWGIHRRARCGTGGAGKSSGIRHPFVNVEHTGEVYKQFDEKLSSGQMLVWRLDLWPVL
jgi:hypothetical protein